MSYMSATLDLLAFTTSLSAKWSDCERLRALPEPSPEPPEAPEPLLPQSLPPLLPLEERLAVLCGIRRLPLLERLRSTEDSLPLFLPVSDRRWAACFFVCFLFGVVSTAI